MLWCFGDSFVHDPCQPWGWTNLVGAHLNCEPRNFGYAGTSLEYTYCKFDQSQMQFSSGDHVIIALTGIWRRYFIYDNPQLSQAWNISEANKGFRFNSIQGKAVGLYFKYIDNQEAFNVGIINFLYRVQQVAQSLDLKVVVLDCFPEMDQITYRYRSLLKNIHYARGNLHQHVSILECVDRQLDLDITGGKKYFKGDPRANHMCRSNHKILADKIINHFETGKTIDVSFGFNSNLITWDNYKDLDHEYCFTETIF